MKKILLPIFPLFMIFLSFAQPVMIKDIFMGDKSGDPKGFIRYNGKVYFQATTEDTSNGVPDQTQTELWVTDGTANGTGMVYDLDISGGGSVNPENFAVANNTLFFTGVAAGGIQLWKSDGTFSGTRVVITSPFPDVFYGSDNTLIPFGNSIYIRAIENALYESSIYKTDGFVAGTKKLSAITTSPGTRTRSAILNNKLFMSVGVNAEDGITGTDGTTGGTFELITFRTSMHSNMLTYKNAFYFIGDTSVNYNLELWKSDGTKPGTIRLKEIRAGKTGIIDYEQTIAANNEYLFFWANDGTHGLELWKTDGSATGTTMVKDITPDSNSTGTSGLLLTVNNRILFSVPQINGSAYYDLWSSDGTEAGTTLIWDSLTSPLDANIKSYDTTANSKLIFADFDRLYFTDGTAEGTGLLTECDLDNGTKFIGELICYNGSVIMNIFDTTYANELYKFDIPLGTGLKDMHVEENLITIYPNPAQNEISISLGLIASITEFIVYDAMGKIWIRESAITSTKTIEIDKLNSGFYFYSIIDNKGISHKGKLIKE